MGWYIPRSAMPSSPCCGGGGEGVVYVIGMGGGIFIVLRGGRVCFHFLDRLALVGVFSGLDFCTRGSLVKWNATLNFLGGQKWG